MASGGRRQDSEWVTPASEGDIGLVEAVAAVPGQCQAAGVLTLTPSIK